MLVKLRKLSLRDVINANILNLLPRWIEVGSSQF